MTKIALALGAGGARGLAHIHVVRAFNELGIKPVCVAGTSIGSIIGAAFCSGMSADEMTDHVYSTVDSPLALVRDMFRIGPDSFGTFFKEGGPRIGELNLERILAGILPDSIPQQFSDLHIPLKVVATDFYGQTMTLFDNGDLRFAIAASSAIPAVFLPVERDGRFYIDGNATNPCPIDIPHDTADHIIGIDVSGGSHGDPKKRPTKVEVSYASGQMMQRSIVNNMAAKHSNAIVLRPPVDNYWSLDFLKAREILSQTSILRDQVKTALENVL